MSQLVMLLGQGQC